MGNFAKAFADGLRPVKITTISDWADEFRYLSRRSSAEPGRWRTDRTPHLREIMNELSLFRPSKKVVIKKAAQMGCTEAAINALGFHIFSDPSSFLMLLPTEQLAKKIAQSKFETMVDSSPELSKLVGRTAENPLSGKEEKNSETILQKDFLNGTIYFGSAASPNSLTSISAKILVMDECDRYRMDVSGEGDPIALAANRCAAMSRHKIILLSTPTIAGESLIENEFAESDQRYFFIPCPSCDHYQRLELKNFRYEMEERTKTAADAWFECQECGDRIEENKKSWFLQRGEYRSTAPGAFPGFHISQFYSPPGWRGWREIATIYNRATTKQDNSLIKAFYNTTLGEAWVEPTSRPAWENIMHSNTGRQPGFAPAGVLIVTAGIDVQADRLECSLLGHSQSGQTHVIDHQVFSGDTSSTAPWSQLEGYLKKPVPSEVENVNIPISMACVDTGYRTTHVYAFIRKFLPGRKVIAVKGRDDLIVPIGRPTKLDSSTTRTSATDRRGIELFPIGVSVLKERIYSDILARPDPETGEYPPNFIFFPELPPEYFRQLTAEESRVTYRKGKEVRTWSKVYTNNECLDCFVYGLSAYYILGIHRYSAAQWQSLNDMLFPAQRMDETVTLPDAGKLPVLKIRKRKSSYWDGEG